MSERSKEPVLKTGSVEADGGSIPSPSEGLCGGMAVMLDALVGAGIVAVLVMLGMAMGTTFRDDEEGDCDEAPPWSAWRVWTVLLMGCSAFISSFAVIALVLCLMGRW